MFENTSLVIALAAITVFLIMFIGRLLLTTQNDGSTLLIDKILLDKDAVLAILKVIGILISGIILFFILSNLYVFIFFALIVSGTVITLKKNYPPGHAGFRIGLWVGLVTAFTQISIYTINEQSGNQQLNFFGLFEKPNIFILPILFIVFGLSIGFAIGKIIEIFKNY